MKGWKVFKGVCWPQWLDVLSRVSVLSRLKFSLPVVCLCYCCSLPTSPTNATASLPQTVLTLIVVPGVGEGVEPLYILEEESWWEKESGRETCAESAESLKVVGGSVVFRESRLVAFKTPRSRQRCSASEFARPIAAMFDKRSVNGTSFVCVTEKDVRLSCFHRLS